MAEKQKVLYSAIIPAFNSEATLEEVITRTRQVFESRGFDYEIIVVNDGSSDNSWEIIRRMSKFSPHIIAISLLQNYGQHNANFCGFRYSKGDFIITLDDDLQNPPEEIPKLISKANEGYDLVIGRFKVKQSSFFRRAGSTMINMLCNQIFKKPPGLDMSNFRLIHRSIIDRVLTFRGINPYIPGLVIAYANKPVNVETLHMPRTAGKSNYSFKRILRLVFSLLFSYTIYPLGFLVFTGVTISFFSFLFCIAVIVSHWFRAGRVPGWASLAALLSFFSGFITLLLGVLGEYVIFITKSVSTSLPYHVQDVSTYDT